MPFLFDLEKMPYQRPFPLSVWGDQSTMETLKQYSNMVVSLETEAEEMRTKIRDLQAKVALFERYLDPVPRPRTSTPLDPKSTDPPDSYPKIEAPSAGAANAA